MIASTKSFQKANLRIGLDWKNEDELLEAVVAPALEGIASDYYLETLNLLGETERGPLGQALLGVIISNTAQFLPSINNTTREDLNTLLARGVAEDISINELTEMINDLFTDFTKSRSETIARTETNRVKSYIQRMSYLESDYVIGLEWLSARDSATRLEHMHADGQVRARGSRFRVGGEWLAYPGDPAGSGWNTINCRCTLIPVLDI